MTLAHSSEAIFAAGYTGLLRIPFSGASATWVSRGVAADESHLYWAEDDTGAILRSNLDGTATVVLRYTGLSVYDLALDETNLYWVETESAANAGRVMKRLKSP